MSDQESVDKGKRVPRERSRQSALVPEPSVNMDELRELIALLRENGLAEFELEREGFRVRLRRDTDASSNSAASSSIPVSSATPEKVSSRAGTTGAQTSATSAPSHPGAQAESAASGDQGLHIIPSPIVGTFYRSTAPTTEPFVKIGSQVGPDSVVCIIEAMKLMNEIQAETSGEIAKIYVENGQPVEYGQPLFGLKR